MKDWWWFFRLYGWKRTWAVWRKVRTDLHEIRLKTGMHWTQRIARRFTS